MNLLPLLAKLVLSSGLLYGYYHFFLRNRRFHHYNRFYLLLAVLVSFVLPFVNIPISLLWGGNGHSTLIQTLKVINVNGWEEPITVYGQGNLFSKWLSWSTVLFLLYAAGLLLMAAGLVKSLLYISRLRRTYRYTTNNGLKIYQTSEPGTPFSYFKSIFWDENIAAETAQGRQILRHEMFHVRQQHSADILLMEIVCCIGWFNPFFHLIKKEIRAIHEFLADAYAASDHNRYDYAALLLQHAIQQKSPSITNPFFHNQIKRRITMITQSNLIRRSGYIGRIMALPLLFVLVSAFAVKFTGKPSAAKSSTYADKTITVVIDPGHGGIYPGAQSTTGIIEKNITLELSKKIEELAPLYNVKTILTRSNDATVGNAADLREDLLNRVKIINEAKADLSISIHTNAGTQAVTSETGFEAYISKKKNDPQARLLASTLLTGIKTIYPITDIIQQRAVGVTVLDKSDCPSVLLECGYITNPADLAFISNPVNQEKIARKILEGIVQYSNAEAGNISHAALP